MPLSTALHHTDAAGNSSAATENQPDDDYMYDGDDDKEDGSDGGTDEPEEDETDESEGEHEDESEGEGAEHYTWTEERCEEPDPWRDKG